jgi:hypothetical protein
MKRFICRLGSIAACAACAITLLAPAKASAYAFVYHFDIGGDPIFSGTPPAASAPWVDAIFQDVAPGVVLLTITNTGLSAAEKLTEFYINLSPALDPLSLSIANVGSSGGFTLPSINQGLNAFKADGDGKYDVRFNFAQPPAGAFTGGEYVTYQISGIASLDATDFIYLSQPAGGHGPFYAAGHVQAIDASSITDETCASGWIAPTTFSEIPIPEPTSASILMVVGGIWLTRRFGRKSRA